MTQMHALLHSAELHYYKKKSDFKYQGFLQAVTHRMQCKKKKETAHFCSKKTGLYISPVSATIKYHIFSVHFLNPVIP